MILWCVGPGRTDFSGDKEAPRRGVGGVTEGKGK